MQGIEDDDAPRVTVEADDASNEGVQRAADAAAAAAHALAGAGYEPRHLSVTSSESGELVLIARLDAHPHAHAQAPAVTAQPVRAPSRAPMWTRLAIGLTAGVLLGFLGLPRLELPSFDLPLARTDAAPTALPIQNLVAPTAVPPTRVPPTPTLAIPTPAPAALFTSQLTQPVAGWPNDLQGTAWFADNEYHFFARDVGRFVATGVPLARPVRDVRISAQFHKVGGPSGGGYGLIVRDQSTSTERDGRNQGGEYLVAEVGDKGDIGIWQRAETHWIDILPWQHSDAVHPDRASNAITLTQHGATLQFLVNGQNVAEIQYTAIPDTGGIGLFAGGDFNEVALESLRIDPAN
jgi:hypothetical protein